MPTRKRSEEMDEHDCEHCHCHGHHGGYVWGVLTGIVLTLAAYGAVRMFCCRPMGAMCSYAPPPMTQPAPAPHK